MDISNFIITIFGSLIGSAITFYFAQNKFRFESLHKKRFEILEEIYQRLIETHSKAQGVIVTDAQNDPEKMLTSLYSYHDSLFAVRDFIDSKKIFLSEREYDLVQRFFHEVNNFENNFGYKSYMKVMPSDDYDAGQTIKEIRQGVYDAIPKILTEIEREFKIVLGLKR